MRILMVAPLVAPLDDRQQLGGAQVLVAELAAGLARGGHIVTLAAADGSAVAGARLAPLGIDARTLQPADLRAGYRPVGDQVAQREAFGRVRAYLEQHRDEIDVVHAHAYDAPAFDVLRGSPRPVLHTLHLLPNDGEVVRAASAARDARIVTVSEANARAWRRAGVDVRGVIHNGVDVGAIPLGTSRGDHLVYAGRLSPEKGVETALDVAAALGRGIVLVGGTYDADYYARAVAPRVHVTGTLGSGPIEGAVYVGLRSRPEVYALMGGAAVTLMPVHWDEPFGLVAVESLATGTAVAGYARGGLPEIVDDTVGALVTPEDADALARAVTRVAGTDPHACRRRATSFGIDAMLARYVALYRELAGASDGRAVGRSL